MNWARIRDLFVGVILLMFGITLCCRGWAALERSETILASRKTGPMSGTQAIVAGVLGIGGGLWWCYASVRKRNSNDKH